MADILIIDDESMIRESLSNLFTREGYSVEVAVDGADGLKKFSENPARVVVTDIVMPEKEGIETITTMRKSNPNLKIIAMSGKGSGDFRLYLEMAGEFGADVAIPKPFSRAQILGAVENLVGAASPH